MKITYRKHNQGQGSKPKPLLKEPNIRRYQVIWQCILYFMEVHFMATNNSGRMEVPEAKEAMDRFKMEVASEIGVP